MKKLLCVAVSLLSTTLVVSCKGKNNKENTDIFTPSLDTNTPCSIKVIGDYSNFEALETEFERFNVHYPNVKLSYEKVDKYGDNLANVLEDKPNIFFSYASYMSGEEKYNSIVAHMENLSDPALKLNIDCIRSGLVNRDASGKVLMVPVFSRTYGTLVNTDIFEKEGLSIPQTWTELMNVCSALKSKGYASPMMGYSKGDSSSWMNTVAYPSFVVTLAGNQEALNKANNLDPTAGEYMREALTKVKQLVDNNAINIGECDKITDNYKQVLLRFFKGDVPMMICTGDTVSGRLKREAESEEFKANPFKYTFVPIPMTEQGGYFIDSPSVEFSVNKDCDNLDMTNEFMRFLLRSEELKTLASEKGLINSTKDVPFDPIYSAFEKIPAERTFSPEVLGVKDQLAKQIRLAAFRVATSDEAKKLTIDEAIAQYGSLK